MCCSWSEDEQTTFLSSPRIVDFIVRVTPSVALTSWAKTSRGDARTKSMSTVRTLLYRPSRVSGVRSMWWRRFYRAPSPSLVPPS